MTISFFIIFLFKYDFFSTHLDMDPISVPLEDNTGKEAEICESKVCSHR